jgi:opacity protein-like surface antigen
MLKYILTLPFVFCSVAYAGERATNSWISVGGEFSSYSMSGYVTRKGNSLLNLNLNISQRVHSDLWVGICGFIGHDSSPEVSRNYDQSLGLSAHWFPLTLSSDSGINHEGLQLTERETYRPFISTQMMFGRALLRRVLNDFDASSDYLGFALGAGSQYAVTPTFSLSASVNYQKNLGLGQLGYDGQKISVGVAMMLLY